MTVNLSDRIYDTVVTAGAYTAQVAAIIFPTSGLTWAVTRFVLPVLGFHTIGKFSLTTISHYAYETAFYSVPLGAIAFLIGIDRIIAGNKMLHHRRTA